MYELRSRVQIRISRCFREIPGESRSAKAVVNGVRMKAYQVLEQGKPTRQMDCNKLAFCVYMVFGVASRISSPFWSDLLKAPQSM